MPAELDDAAILDATAAKDVDEPIATAPRVPAPRVTEPRVAEPRVAEPLGGARSLAGSPRRAGAPAAAGDEPVASESPAHSPAHRDPPAAHVEAHEAPTNGQLPPGGTDHVAGVDPFERSATAPQLRRFIKSRAYVPMHELRRRFAINGGEDDVTPIDLERERVYVGLPPREGDLLGELLRAGDIGYELSMDPIAPIVVGVFPMRPVPRS